MSIYLPYEQRTRDFQYRQTLRQIIREGVHTKNEFQTTGTLTSVTTRNMVFRLANGAPLITEREIGFWRRPISEIIGFINGAHTLEELRKYGDKKTWASWWARWASEHKCGQFRLEPGDLGPGSYGAGYHHDGFNQWYHLVKQIRERPWLRTHRVTPWIPKYCLQHSELQRKVVVAPCHGDVQVTILDGKMFLRMDQRSGDVPIGIPSNMIQYAALLLMLAQVTGYEPHTIIHSIHDAQIYEDQVPYIKRLIRRRPNPFPTLRIMDTKIDDLFAFRPEHFELTDYNPHPAMNDIPVTE
ncbi:MAG: thymidylate synthase [Parcubacteria group bacterium]|nr:thymidylate synthase [Parcubacteria group bacterium]